MVASQRPASYSCTGDECTVILARASENLNSNSNGESLYSVPGSILDAQNGSEKTLDRDGATAPLPSTEGFPTGKFADNDRMFEDNVAASVETSLSMSEQYNKSGILDFLKNVQDPSMAPEETLTIGELRGATHSVASETKRRVQWNDSHGKDLVHVMEFEPSDTGGSEDEEDDTETHTCTCTIQ